MPKLLISGETGDILRANGSQIEIDECLGNFYTARQYLKFYGQNWIDRPQIDPNLLNLRIINNNI